MLVIVEIDSLDPLEASQDVHLGVWVTRRLREAFDEP
jgi:hypothetical protein